MGNRSMGNLFFPVSYNIASRSDQLCQRAHMYTGLGFSLPGVLQSQPVWDSHYRVLCSHIAGLGFSLLPRSVAYKVCGLPPPPSTPLSRGTRIMGHLPAYKTIMSCFSEEGWGGWGGPRPYKLPTWVGLFPPPCYGGVGAEGAEKFLGIWGPFSLIFLVKSVIL